MARVLVAYASTEGQTEHIAHHVARKLEDAGHVTRLIGLSSCEGEAGADDYDASILASSIHRGRFAPELTSFLMRHGPAIRAHRSAFLTVSLSAASQDEKERAGLREVTDRFLFESGWQPDFVEHVAGAVHDRLLSVFERAVLHAVVRQHGEELDPTGNTEFTDWPRLDTFVKSFEAGL